MPVTPFHFGPGALIKGFAPAWFCWSSFALANVLIDLEPITHFLLTGDPAHPWLHTLPGALLVAAIAATLGRRPCEWMLRQWNAHLSVGQACWLAVDAVITARQAWVGALLGTLSHLALDAIMHVDVRPLWPFMAGNPWPGVVSLDLLHLGCILAAAVAVPLWLVQRLRQRVSTPS